MTLVNRSVGVGHPVARPLLALLLTVASVAGCKSGPAADDPAPPPTTEAAGSEGSGAVVPASQLATTPGAPAAAVRPPVLRVQAPPATRPDWRSLPIPPQAEVAYLLDMAGLLAAAPALGVPPERISAAVNARVAEALGDPAFVTRMQPATAAPLVFASLRRDDRTEDVLLADASLLVAPPADGAGMVAIPGGLQAAVRGGRLHLGRGAAFGSSLPETRGEASGPPVVSQAVWDALPTTAVWTMVYRNWEALPADARRTLAAFEGAGATGLGVAVALDGSVTFVAEVADTTVVQQNLGRAQAWLHAQLGLADAQVPAEYRSWVRYLNRVVQGLWARFAVTEPGPGLVRIELSAPDCGGPLRNLSPLLLLAWSLERAAIPGLELPATSWTPMAADLRADCSAVAGPGPQIPVALARLANAEVDAGLVVLFDQAAGLRSVLPDLGGLLPFGLPDETLADVLGPRPLGLNGLDDAEGKGAFVMDAAPPGQTSAQVLVLHRGLTGLVPEGEPILRMLPDTTRLYGRVYATPDFPVTARMSTPDAPHAWVAAAAQTPQEAWVTVLVGTRPLRQALALPPEAAWTQALTDAHAVGVSWTPDGVTVTIAGTSVGSAALEAGLVEALVRAASRGGSGPPSLTPPPTAWAAGRTQTLRDAASALQPHLTWRTIPGGVQVTVPHAAWNELLAVGLDLLVPTVRGWLPQQGLDHLRGATQTVGP